MVYHENTSLTEFKISNSENLSSYEAILWLILFDYLNSYTQCSMLCFSLPSNFYYTIAPLSYLSSLYNQTHNNSLKYVYRIKKLIDMEVLGLSRLQVIVLDMHTDVKGYSLLSLPQVRFDDSCPHLPNLLIFIDLLQFFFGIDFQPLNNRDEFWDLYKCYFHQRVLEGDLRICLYGPIPVIHSRK